MKSLSKNNNEFHQYNFFTLVSPIFIDNFFRMITLVVSYGLISRISDAMAGILGVTNLYLLVGFSLSECLAQGSSIILTQYLGAKKNHEVGEVCSIMIWLNLFLGIFLSLVCLCWPYFLLSTFNFSPQTIDGGAHYLRLVGSGFCIYSFNYALLYILNAHGLTKYSMCFSLLVNGSTLILFYVIAILPLNFPLSRLSLIAISNVLTRGIGMLFLLAIISSSVPQLNFYRKIPWKRTKQYLSHFLQICLPNAIEPLSYQLFQFILVKIISMLSVEAIAIRSYIIALTSLFETSSWSISKGNQIILGHLVGAKRNELVNSQLRKGITTSLFASIITLFFVIIFRHQLMSFFSKETSIIDIGSDLLILVAILTLIRAFTFNLLSGLKASGDIKFGFFLTSFGMWCITLPGALILTRFFDVGIQGIWIMLTVDEIIRVFFLFQRWRSQKWKRFSVV